MDRGREVRESRADEGEKGGHVRHRRTPLLVQQQPNVQAAVTEPLASEKRG
jgi:hypothetical protein